MCSKLIISTSVDIQNTNLRFDQIMCVIHPVDHVYMYVVSEEDVDISTLNPAQTKGSRVQGCNESGKLVGRSTEASPSGFF
jgi:hypothetical protein